MTVDLVRSERPGPSVNRAGELAVLGSPYAVVRYASSDWTEPFSVLDDPTAEMSEPSVAIYPNGDLLVAWETSGGKAKMRRFVRLLTK